MLDQNQIDWNAVSEDAKATTTAMNTTASQGKQEASKFIRLKAGFHYLRIVPAGNALQKKPYLHMVQHPMKVPREDGNGFMDAFILCWSHVLNDLVKLGNPEAQKTRSIVSYLGQVQAINQEQFKMYQTYGCPMCKAYNHLNQMGVAQETKQKFYPAEQYFFNVIHRSFDPSGNPSFGDDNVYIWRQAKTNGKRLITTINTMRQNANINYLDINTGRDIILQATGEKLGRRYPVCQFTDFQTPLNLGERIPHNLLDIVVKSHYDYQKVVNFMKVTYGKLLSENGYVIPGDQAMTQQYGESITRVNPNVEHIANQSIAQVQNPSQFVAPVSVVQTSPVTAEPQFDPSFQSGDTIIEKDGKLFNTRTGKFLF